MMLLKRRLKAVILGTTIPSLTYSFAPTKHNVKALAKAFPNTMEQTTIGMMSPTHQSSSKRTIASSFQLYSELGIQETEDDIKMIGDDSAAFSLDEQVRKKIVFDKVYFSDVYVFNINIFY